MASEGWMKHSGAVHWWLGEDDDDVVDAVRGGGTNRSSRVPPKSHKGEASINPNTGKFGSNLIGNVLGSPEH